MMMTVMRVTISRRDTADTAITDEILSLHVSLFSITDVGNSCVPQLPEIDNNMILIIMITIIVLYTDL